MCYLNNNTYATNIIVSIHSPLWSKLEIKHFKQYTKYNNIYLN